MIGRILGLLTCERGTAAIEAGIVLPVFIALTIGIVDLGTAMYEKQAMNAAAQAGAAYEVINLSATGISTIMDYAAGNVSATGLTITATTPSGGVVTVTASHTFTPIFPVSVFAPWVASPFNLSSTVTVRIE